MYSGGQGIPQDYKQAIKWYTLAAIQGSRTAQGILGFMYSNGQGVIQDYKQSFKWYTLAAEQVNNSAQFSLGGVYALGKGVPQNYVMAHMWSNIAAFNGESTELRDYLTEIMTPPQIDQAQQKAREWLKKHGK